MRLRLPLLALACIGLLPLTAPAQVVTVQFTGKVTSLTPYGPLFGTLGNGDTFTGGFSFNSGLADTDGRPFAGFFADAITDSYVDFGAGKGGKFTKSGPQSYNNVQINNDRTDYDLRTPPVPFDGFYAYANMGLAGYSWGLLGLSMQSIRNPLGSDALPTTATWSDFLFEDTYDPNNPSLVMGAGMELHAVFGQGCEEQWVDDCARSVYGQLTSISAVTTVPEPSTSALVAAGVLSLLVVARHRRRA
jgi:hypothetical protein